MKTTIVYVDGHNLYYGLKRYSDRNDHIKCKWLDIYKLCRVLLPTHEIIKIKYFTSRVSRTKDNPEQESRQNSYLEVLKANDLVEIYYGKFVPRYRQGYRMEKQVETNEQVRIHTWEEKGADVCLALHLLNDAYKHMCNFPVIITNDSDQITTIKLVRSSPLMLPIGIINPQPMYGGSKELRTLCTFYKEIRESVLEISQFPDEVTTAHGIFRRPESW